MQPNPTDFIGMVKTIVLDFRRKCGGGRVRCRVEDSDEYADAMVGCVVACERFKPDMEYQPSTFVWHYAWGYMMRGIEVRSRTRRLPIISFQDVKGDPAMKTPIPMDRIGSLGRKCQSQTVSECNLDLSFLTRKLPWRLHYVLLQRFALERSLDDIAADMGVSKERVRQLEIMALKKVRTVNRITPESERKRSWCKGTKQRKERAS